MDWRSHLPGPILISLPSDTSRTTKGSTQLQQHSGVYKEIPSSYDDDANSEATGLLLVDEESASAPSNTTLHNLLISRRFLNPFSLDNAALTLSFMQVGIAGYLLYSPVSYYLVNTLDASAASLSAFSTLATLPWSLKFLFGILSDTTPVFQYRRKSWLLIGWLFYIILGIYMSRQSQPGVAETTLVFFLATCSYLLSDVCGDTLCVERGRAFENSRNKGTLQTSGYTSRSFGAVVGALLGAVLFNKSQWGWGLSISDLFLLSSLLAMFPLLPSIWFLSEIRAVYESNPDGRIRVLSSPPLTSSKHDFVPTKHFVPPTLRQQASEIWETLQLQAVYRPMSFIFSFYMLQIPNSAWTNFLLVGLGFTDFELGCISVGSAVFLWAGMVAWKLFFFQTSWRRIFIYTTALSFFFSVLQVLLVLRVNVMFGIPDFAFALGDSVVVQLIYAVQSMPSSIMFILLCPEGSEGVTYALLTTVGNLAWTLAQDFGTCLTLVFDVKNSTLAAGNFRGVLHLTIFTSLIQLLPIFWVHLLPDDRAEHVELIHRQVKSRLGGGVLAFVIIASLAGTIIVNLYYIIQYSNEVN